MFLHWSATVLPCSSFKKGLKFPVLKRFANPLFGLIIRCRIPEKTQEQNQVRASAASHIGPLEKTNLNPLESAISACRKLDLE